MGRQRGVGPYGQSLGVAHAAQFAALDIRLLHPAAARGQGTAPQQPPVAAVAPVRIHVTAEHSTSGYNALLYLALNTSSAINVTLVGASTPVWMLLIGRLVYGHAVSGRQLLGAALSICGVALVLCRGDWAVLMGLELVAGDLYVLAASIGWAFYSWMLAHPTPESAPLRSDWAAFLMSQVIFGLGWSVLFAATEWTLTPVRLQWSWPLLAALLYIASGPAVLAYRAWGAGIGRAGPAVAGFFTNLTPLFAALLSLAFLGEAPHGYHAMAFVLIVSGIVQSSRR